MKIGFFTNGYLPQKNGVATTVAGYAKALRKQGHEVYIIAPKYPHYKNDTKNIIRLTSLKVQQKTDIRVALYLPERGLAKALSIDFDIIHGHSGGPITLLGWEVARRKNIPFVLTYHTLWTKYTHYFFKGLVITPKMVERASKVFGNTCDGIIAPTGRVKKELKTYGIKKPIDIIPNGIHLSNFENVTTEYLHRKAKILHQTKIILYLGRLGKEKSIDVLLKAFQRVHRELPQTAFVLIGEGTEKENLENLAKKLKIADAVYFLGGIDYKHVPKALAGSDLFVFASKTETQGMVVLEALASGLPVVAVNAHPFKDIITPPEHGLLAKYDPKDFAEKMITSLTDEEYQQKVAEKAKRKAAEFSLEALTPELEKFYQNVIINSRKDGKSRLRNKLKLVKSYLDVVLYK